MENKHIFHMKDGKYRSSTLTNGLGRSGQRALLYAAGMDEEDMKKPFVAVISSFKCPSHSRELCPFGNSKFHVYADRSSWNGSSRRWRRTCRIQQTETDCKGLRPGCYGTFRKKHNPKNDSYQRSFVKWHCWRHGNRLLYKPGSSSFSNCP
jgi:hypothetical protein